MTRLSTVLGWLVLAGSILFTGALSADEAPPKSVPSPPTHVVFVPYDRMTGPEWGAGESVLVPYARFLELESATGPEIGPKAEPIASLSSMNLTGEVRGSVAVLDGELVLRVLAGETDALSIALPFANASIERLSIEGGEAIAAPSDAQGVLLRLKGPGDRTIKLRIAVPIIAEAADRLIDFSIPRAAAASLRLALADAADLLPLDGDTPAFIDGVTPGATAFVAGIGGQPRVRLSWRPRAEAAASAEARVSAVTQLFATVTMAGVELRAETVATVLAGEVSSLALAVPVGLRVLSVSGPYVRDWTGPGDSGLLTVQLLRAAGGEIPLTVEAQLATQDGERVSIPALRLADAVRESGTVTVIPSQGLDLWPEVARGLQPAANPGSAPKLAGVRTWSFGAPGWDLSFSRQVLRPALRADSLLYYEVSNELVRLQTVHNISVGSQGIFGVRLLIPGGYELLEAEPADLVSGSRQDGTTVDLNFRAEQRQAFTVRLRLQRARTTVEEDVALLPVSIAGADEDLGAVVLAAPPALRPTEVRADSLRPADVRNLDGRISALPRTSDAVPVLGYRYVSPRFNGLVKVERQRTRLTCETAILVSVEPTLLKVNAWLDWNVEFSATDEFQLLLPAASGDDVRIEGADIKEKTRSATAREDGMAAWSVRLQRRVLGAYRLHVSYDVPIEAQSGGKPANIGVPLPRADGAARETGHVAISRNENIEVRVEDAPGLERRDVKELPAALASAFLGFRYFDPAAAKLVIQLVRHDLETVLGALVRRLHIESVVNDQREALHEVWLDVQNNREQYLELRLPEGMEIWSAFVAGAPVRPARREGDGAHLVELTKSETASAAFRVRLVLRETMPGGKFGWRGTLNFTPPQILNIPVLRTTWKTYLPRNWRYTQFSGTMRPEFAGTRPWLEPFAEEVLTTIPADLAGGIAKPQLSPPVGFEQVAYDANESPGERQARIASTALDIPIVKEGAQFEFSRLSGLGTIEIRYWSRKVLLVAQGAFALLFAAALLVATGGTRRPAVAVVVLLATFVAASLLDGGAGRFAATALSMSLIVTAIVVTAVAAGKLRAASAAAANAAWNRQPHSVMHLREHESPVSDSAPGRKVDFPLGENVEDILTPDVAVEEGSGKPGGDPPDDNPKAGQ